MPDIGFTRLRRHPMLQPSSTDGRQDGRPHHDHPFGLAASHALDQRSGDDRTDSAVRTGDNRMQARKP